jgi:hypothetical protein
VLNRTPLDGGRQRAVLGRSLLVFLDLVEERGEQVSASGLAVAGAFQHHEHFLRCRIGRSFTIKIAAECREEATRDRRHPTADRPRRHPTRPINTHDLSLPTRALRPNEVQHIRASHARRALSTNVKKRLQVPRQRHPRVRSTPRPTELQELVGKRMAHHHRQLARRQRRPHNTGHPPHRRPTFDINQASQRTESDHPYIVRSELVILRVHINVSD